jgi:hypothetical protein
LRVLRELDGPAGAARIMRKLGSTGVDLQPRTIRFYLMQLDSEGMTRIVSRRQGREITNRGIEELDHSNVTEKVGFIAAKVDTLGYRMSFNNALASGTIIANMTIVDKRVISMALREMEHVFDARIGMGRLMCVLEPGQRLGRSLVPDGAMGIGTVCSVTANGILLNEGIPVTSRFGGLIEMCEGEAVRFVELIEYRGTTLDPLEAFIRAGMTSVRDCARTGSGLIGASFREVPAAAVDEIRGISKAMGKCGLGGVLSVGDPSRPLLDIPVAEGRAGMIVVGGLNPIAAAHEAGIRLSMVSLAGLENFDSFMNYQEACSRYA